jgi:PadR family transcriptional regulator PadR
VLKEQGEDLSAEMRKYKDNLHSAGNYQIDVRPRNWMTPVALVVLREETCHGYELMEELEELGFGEINAGTLYRTLRQIEREGLCRSEWETSNSGPARRVYSLTDAGEDYLEAWAEGCKKYQQIMDAFNRTYDASRQPHASSENGHVS